MNRPKFLHPLGETRHARRHRRRGDAHPPASIPSAGATAAPGKPNSAPVAEPTPAPGAAAHLPTRTPDLDVQRVQAAGGPLDHASYSCSCGYLFSADVSTSVTCPHCGTGQAW